MSHIKLAKYQDRRLSSYLLILHISPCSSLLWQACTKYLNQTKTKQKKPPVFPLLLPSKQCHFIAVFLVRKEQEIGLTVSSFRVPADELVDQYLNCLKWFQKVSFPALHSEEQCGGSPVCWLSLFFYLSRLSVFSFLGCHDRYVLSLWEKILEQFASLRKLLFVIPMLKQLHASPVQGSAELP